MASLAKAWLTGLPVVYVRQTSLDYKAMLGLQRTLAALVILKGLEALECCTSREKFVRDVALVLWSLLVLIVRVLGFA